MSIYRTRIPLIFAVALVFPGVSVLANKTSIFTSTENNISFQYPDTFVVGNFAPLRCCPDRRRKEIVLVAASVLG